MQTFFIKPWAACSAIALASIFVTSCGSGSGGEDSEETIRPKTMDGIVLTLDTNASIEFSRSAGSAPALRSGDIETGSFIYTALPAFNVLKKYPNADGTESNVRYPSVVNSPSYTYRAINETSGILTMNGIGVIGTEFIEPSGGVALGNDSWLRLFNSHSPQSPINPTNLVEIAFTFSSTGSVISATPVTLRLPESGFRDSLDSVRVPTNLRLATGGGVPPNYNPVVDPFRPSKIVPASLNQRLFVATHEGGSVIRNFTVQFTSDAFSIPGSSFSGGVEELGKVIVSVFDPNITPPGLRAISMAADYTWRRVPGSERGILVLSNIPEDPTLPFDDVLNTRFTLDFGSPTTGSYAGEAPDPSDVRGTFLLTN